MINNSEEISFCITNERKGESNIRYKIMSFCLDYHKLQNDRTCRGPDSPVQLVELRSPNSRQKSTLLAFSSVRLHLEVVKEANLTRL